jgi:hypothetical protein
MKNGKYTLENENNMIWVSDLVVTFLSGGQEQFL